MHTDVVVERGAFARLVRTDRNRYVVEHIGSKVQALCTDAHSARSIPGDVCPVHEVIPGTLNPIQEVGVVVVVHGQVVCGHTARSGLLHGHGTVGGLNVHHRHTATARNTGRGLLRPQQVPATVIYFKPVRPGVVANDHGTTVVVKNDVCRVERPAVILVGNCPVVRPVKIDTQVATHVVLSVPCLELFSQWEKWSECHFQNPLYALNIRYKNCHPQVLAALAVVTLPHTDKPTRNTSPSSIGSRWLTGYTQTCPDGVSRALLYICL